MDNHIKLLTKLAQDYYISNLSIGELVEKYNISRYLINKYLDDAKKEKIVTININTPVERQTELERTFHDFFDIESIYVIKDNDLSEGQSANLIQFAASELFHHIKDSHITATTWGGTMYDVIEKLPKEVLQDHIFTQFIGENRKYKSEAGSMRMVQKIADNFSANYLTLSGPLYITNPNTRQGMLNDIASQETMTAAQNIDLIFCGLGTLASINSIPTWRDNIDLIFSNINTDDIAGMIFGRPYDRQGHFLNMENDCTFGIDLDTILKIPKRIGIVKSKFKSQSTIGALRGKFFTELIISESVARRILSEI